MSKGKNIVGGNDNVLIKMWVLSYHTTLCKLKKLLMTHILILKSIVYIVVALKEKSNFVLNRIMTKIRKITYENETKTHINFLRVGIVCQRLIYLSWTKNSGMYIFKI
jgi:hypothetical protein